MTVNELIEKLKRHDGNALVVIMSYFTTEYMGIKEVFQTKMNKGAFNEKKIVVIHNNDDDFELDNDAYFTEQSKKEV